MKNRFLVQVLLKHNTTGTYKREAISILTTPDNIDAALTEVLAAQYPEHTLEKHLVEPRRLLVRYRRICGHLICHSLGYLTPRSAEAMLEQFRQGKPFWCEWIYDMHLKGGKDMFTLTKETLQRSIRTRKHDHGFMSDIGAAYSVINHELAGCGPVFASWF